jgi:hypothetical protein
VVPPSIHPDGPIYRWLNDEPITNPPSWLLVLARKPPTQQERSQASNTSQKFSGTPGAYGAAALKDEIDALAAMAPNTGRNIQLNRASFCLHQLVAGCELEAEKVEEELIKAAIANGLVADDGMKQCLATIRSGARPGLLLPRSRPGGGA